MKCAFRGNRPLFPLERSSIDSRGRSLAKTVVYHVWAVAFLAAISYYFTGNAREATTITVLFNAGGTLACYGLERLWESLDWGRGASESGPRGSSALTWGKGLAAGFADSRMTVKASRPANKTTCATPCIIAQDDRVLTALKRTVWQNL